MIRFVGALLLIVAVMMSANDGARAEIDLCQAIALRDLAAQPGNDDHPPFSAVKRGDIYPGISQYNVSKETGLASICSHGGGCAPAQVFEGGKKVDVFRLTNCKVGKSDYQDDDEIFYKMVLDRSKVAPADLKRVDIDDKLIQLGLCSACADNLTEFFLKKPASRCGQLVGRALKGSARALDALKSNPAYCTASN